MIKDNLRKKYSLQIKDNLCKKKTIFGKKNNLRKNGILRKKRQILERKTSKNINSEKDKIRNDIIPG